METQANGPGSSPALPAPGSPTYIPALLAYLQREIATGGEEWTIDPSLFSALLLSQILGVDRGGVIVDVLPTENGRTSDGVRKAVDAVQAMTRGVFGMTTHHVHLSRHTHPSDLPYALFLDPAPSWPALPSRKSSLSTSIQPRASRRSTISTPSSKYVSALPSPIFPRSYRAQSSRTTTPGVTPGITPKNSLPLLSPNSAVKSEYGFGPPLVVQRNGSSDRTHDRMEVFAGGREEREEGKRPSLPQCLVVSGLERADSPVWGKLVEILLKGYVEVEMEDVQRSERGDMAGGTPIEAKTERWDLPEGFWVVWVREEERSEACPSWLIDQFSCSICVHPDDLDATPSLPLRAVIPSSYIRSLHSLLPYTHIHPPLQTHLANLLSSLTAHPRLTSSITGRAALLFPDYARAHRLISAPFALPDEWQHSAEFRRQVKSSAKCLSGGGGVSLRAKKQDEGLVDTWGVLAGEEPSVACLGDGSGGDGEWDLDVPMGSVHAVFALAMRHRLKWRDERDEVMWLVKATPGYEAVGGDRDNARKEKRRGRRKRREVDMIMEEVMAVV